MNFGMAIFWAAIGLPLSFAANGGTFFACLGLAVLPLALTLWGKRRGDAAANRNFDELLRLAAMSRVAGMSHFEGGTAIAVDPAQGKILLVRGKAARAYRLADVRSWTTRDADANSAFIVDVRDLANPKWEIAMFDKAERARWNELLQQLINEGAIEVRHASA